MVEDEDDEVEEEPMVHRVEMVEKMEMKFVISDQMVELSDPTVISSLIFKETQEVAISIKNMQDTNVPLPVE